MVNIFGSVGQMVSIETAQICSYSSKQSRLYVKYVDEQVWLCSNKALFTKQVVDTHRIQTHTQDYINMYIIYILV